MPKSLYLRNVPDGHHRRLRERAAKASMTLSQYIVSRLLRAEQAPPSDAWLARRLKRAKTTLDVSAAEVIREGRRF